MIQNVPADNVLKRREKAAASIHCRRSIGPFLSSAKALAAMYLEEKSDVKIA
jgi:hypothetical protein